MKQLLAVVFLFLLLTACSERSEQLMTVSGNIDGLKKGMLFLQKIEDSVLINVDSLELRGDGIFSLQYPVSNPEVFYLYLNKADNNAINDRITFFGEAGEIVITSVWNQFEAKAKVEGSKSHSVFTEYQDMMSNFNKRDLEIAQAVYAASDTINVDSLELLAERNYVNRYRYLLNFSLAHPESYVTPYIALTDGAEANPVYLDSILNGLTNEVANSKYGKALEVYMESLKVEGID